MVYASVVLTLIFLAGDKAIAAVSGKIVEYAGKPILEVLEDKARWLTGTGETAKRWEAFSKAFEEAKAPYLKETPNPEVARLLVGVLEKLDAYPKAERGWLIPLSDEPGKALAGHGSAGPGGPQPAVHRRISAPGHPRPLPCRTL
jgi:hypothetical protein